MYEDVESDYWKEIFVHIQHKNMMRTAVSQSANQEGPKGQADDARFDDKLTVKNATSQFDLFSRRNPAISPIVEGSSSYFTWEVFVTPTIKVRLFIQNQIKCSLMQNISGDFTKIADAKFPNNPFPELEEFLGNRDQYKKELASVKEKSIRNAKQQKIAGEFIKAYAGKKLGNKVWYLEQAKATEEGDFILTIDRGSGDKQEIPLTIENFVEKISNI